MLWLPPQENAHFSISESLIAAIELMKCNVMNRRLEEEEEESDKEIQELKQKIRIRRQQIRTKHLLPAYRELGSDSECCFLGARLASQQAEQGLVCVSPCRALLCV